MEAINAPQAWADGYDGTGARVAVIDGGINDTHGDLAGQVDGACSASFYPPHPYNFDTGFFWHGSHVAGIVAAADNSFGTVGVAPGATIMAVKVLHSGSGPFSGIINGILFASDPGSFAGFESCERADIINMSLSAEFFKSSIQGFHSIVNKAVNFAASKGVLVISAAANNGLDFGQLRDAIVIPAQSGSGLAISATGPLGWAVGATDFRRFASYSNWGEDLVNLAGPGGDFAYPGNESCTVDGTTFPCWVFDMVPAPCGGGGGNFTCWVAGTSQASPAAAGVAALIVGANPGISLGKLKAMLKNSADDEGKRGKDEFYGHGFINAYKAVMQ
jgi:subtilisin family serine protease